MGFEVVKLVRGEGHCLFLLAACHGHETCKGRVMDVWPCKEHAVQPKARQEA